MALVNALAFVVKKLLHSLGFLRNYLVLNSCGRKQNVEKCPR